MQNRSWKFTNPEDFLTTITLISVIMLIKNLLPDVYIYYNLNVINIKNYN